MKNDQDYRNVLMWFLSFIPFGALIILFVFCFLYFTKPILYLFCALSLALFLILYIPADKRIQHPDGYSLVQAMWFVLNCRKNGLSDVTGGRDWRKVEKEARNYTYAKDLDRDQLKAMYCIGAKLVDRFPILRK